MIMNRTGPAFPTRAIAVTYVSLVKNGRYRDRSLPYRHP